MEREHDEEIPKKTDISDEDLNVIADMIKDGNTRGLIDGEGTRITWDITIEKFLI
jgi:hypothetical protein